MMLDRHLCHAEGCKEPVPPAMLMCYSHWRMVPVELKHGVWETYREGQEIDKRPSAAYLAAARAAIEAVARKEGIPNKPTKSSKSASNGQQSFF